MLGWTCGAVLAQARYRSATISPVSFFSEFRKGLKLKDSFTKEILFVVVMYVVG